MSVTFFVSNHYSDAPQMNVSNMNAFSVLRDLGIDAEYSGTIDAADLLNRLQSTTMVDCPEYAYWGASYADRLISIARRAIYENEKVTWC